MTKKEQDREYYLRNKERILQKAREYRENNKDILKTRNKENYEKNREERKQKMTKYHQENRETLLANRRKRYHSDKEFRNRDNELSRQWREENKDKYLAQQALWRKENLAAINKHSAKRRATKLQATPKNWGDNELNEFVLTECYDLSKLRSELTGIDWHVDHVIPLKNDEVCGLHVYNNLQIIPAIENLRKSNSLNL